MNTWTGDGDEDQADEHGPLCLNCLRRPARPGSPYCGRLCRWLDAGRRLRLLARPGAVLAAAAALALVLAACTARPDTPRVTRTSPPAARVAAPATAARCAWYTVTDNDGQNVVVTATGTACGRSPLADRLAALTRRTWISTRYVHGTCIAQLGRAGVVLRIYEAGWALATKDTAGYLADDLAAAGWQVQQAPGGGSTPPPLPTPIGSA